MTLHYYKRNIGDYHKKAGRLTILQHGVYSLLIDACYDREIFPTLNEALDWVWASSNEEIDAVEFILKKFFHEQNGIYVQNRIRQEIERYHLNSATNKRIAVERETKRKENSTKRVRTVNEPPPNHKPLTTKEKDIVQKDLDETKSDDEKKPSIREITDHAFTYIWGKLPRKENKKKARQKFGVLAKGKTTDSIRELTNKISKDIDYRLKSYKWDIEEPEFIPLPVTYFNNEPWNDTTQEFNQ